MFGKKLKKLREERGISREQLATDLDISYWTITKYELEDRNPSVNVITKTANYFGVSTDYLLGRSNLSNDSDNVISLDELPEEEQEHLKSFFQYLKEEHLKKERSKNQKKSDKKSDELNLI